MLQIQIEISINKKYFLVRIENNRIEKPKWFNRSIIINDQTDEKRLKMDL